MTREDILRRLADEFGDSAARVLDRLRAHIDCGLADDTRRASPGHCASGPSNGGLACRECLIVMDSVDRERDRATIDRLRAEIAGLRAATCTCAVVVGSRVQGRDGIGTVEAIDGPAFCQVQWDDIGHGSSVSIPDLRLIGHAAGCPAVERARLRQERDYYRQLCKAQQRALGAADAHAPACPSATAKKAREGT